MAHDEIGPLMDSMRVAIEKHLTNDVNRSVLQPGASVTADDCCEGGGLFYVRLISIVGASAASNPAAQPCSQLYQIRLGIGTRRCAHTLDDTGAPPTPKEMISDVMLMMQDRADIMEGIVCEVYEMLDARGDSSGKTLRIEDWLPSNIQGGCQGGEVTIAFKHVLCTGCPEED